MTRENKLALVIGFGLMLFVGILVSDHFAAQRFDPASVTQSEPAAPDQSVQLEAVGVVALEDAPQPPTGAPDLAAGGTSAHPDAVAGDASTAIAGIDPVPAPMAVEVAVADGTPVRFHKIQQGDNYWKIAKAEYGDGSLADRLQEYNKAVAPDAARLKLGSELRIPPVDVLRPGAAAAVASSAVAPATAPSAETKVAARTYKVQKGDTPYAIARKQGVKVAELLQQNGIKDPSGLKPGQTIRIPVRK